MLFGIYHVMSCSNFIFHKTKLLNNFLKFPTQNVCAVVKANAYGCGVETVCKALADKVNFFAVATLQEAVLIRQFDSKTPILVLGVCADYLLAYNNNISVMVESLNEIKKIISLKIPIKIHVKINTGMNRYGFKNKKQYKIIKKILKNNKKIIFEGIFTHFYNTNNIEVTNLQLKKFKEAVVFFKMFSPLAHIGGGGVMDILQYDDYKDYMIRVGFKLYQNTVIVTSKIVKTFLLRKGENLGYVGTRFSQDKYIGVVPLGYADGVSRGLSGKAYVKIAGKNCKIVGNVCMDVFFVDLTGCNVGVGDDVVVFDDPNSWAKILDTLPYEILTSINSARMNKVEK